jgi:hypothetical protein
MTDDGCGTSAVPAPPLPERCATAAPSLLRSGCHLLELVSRTDLSVLVGTLRVEATADGVAASGDLYTRPEPEAGRVAHTPDPATDIPIFSVADYRCYLRVTGVEQSAEGVTLTIEEHRFQEAGIEFLDGKWPWARGSTFALLLTPGDGPLLTGVLADSRGTPFWEATVRRVSPYLRRATLEIDRVPLSDWPDTSGTDLTMRTVFEEVGWDLTGVRSHVDVTEPSGESWGSSEAHAMMRALRDRSDLDAEWRYHCLAVRRVDHTQTKFGWMYDDTDDSMREGFMVASHWVLPDEPRWGRAQGKRFGTVAPAYFRTTVHELGHAMGLDHNGQNGFMAATETVAGQGLLTPETPFPDNILMSFSDDDRHRLRHWPDHVVGPGTPVRSGASAPRG